MVENLIAGYLATGKRLVIPDLGAFLKKDTGETVFVEFLKKDDGILSRQVSESMGITTLEAASIVLQFSADIKTALGSKGFYIIPNVGTLRRDGSGNITLSPMTEIPRQEPVTVPIAPLPDPTPVSPARLEIQPDPKPVQSVRTGPANPSTVQPAAAEFQTIPRPKPVIENPVPGRLRQSHPEPGMRKPVASPAKKKTDLIMVIAIAAALIAIGAMVYGLMVDRNPIKSLQPTQERLIDNPVDNGIELIETE